MSAAMPEDSRFTVFAGAKVVITGGLGFIGATLARRLVGLGGDVLILDSVLPGSGANPFNLDGIADRVVVERCDIRDGDAMRRHLAGKTFLFNLAAQTSHQGSMVEPLLDLDINCRAQLALLETCRAVAPEIAIVFASTRQIYGRPEYLPVDEKHPVRPPDVNGIDKAAAESFHLLYHRVHGLRSTALRLTNTYGPRMRIADARQAFVGHWLRAVIEGREFEVWGGEQLRDLTYVDDAVEAFLLAAVAPSCAGLALNIGGEAMTLRRLAELLLDANGGGRFAIREFPAERKQIDIGAFTSDDARFRSLTGWAPRTGIAAGLAQSLAFFRANLPHYRQGL
ncbi:MAG: NAD-dependent epimerase [Rhodospirillales bacterium]|jgi:UDP-glucose 4-epimerase|nr:NAD-dependent epimerase [Rhodospirillales bacterium]